MWCDRVFSEWFSHRGIGPGARLGELFPGVRELCRPGAVYEDADKKSADNAMEIGNAVAILMRSLNENASMEYIPLKDVIDFATSGARELVEAAYKRLNVRFIGLYLVKKIASRYGGRVWVKDRVHGDYRKGASVIITIPLK